jgi:cytoskeletal protein CcmA (bactofilin family)
MSGIAQDLMENARRSASQSVTKLASRLSTKPDAANDDTVVAAPTTETAPKRPDPSVLSANTEMKGSITTSDELFIQGKLEGNVRATSVIVCPGGVVRGDIHADSVAVHGVVNGNIQGRDVRLCAGAVVDGEIRHNTLGIEPGANFEGSIKRIATETAVAAE